MQREDFDKWVQAYIKAWESNERANIEALFAEDASYLTQAFREPWAGRKTIVENWLGRDDSPGDWDFGYHWWAIEGDTGVLEGVTRYHSQDTTFTNIWVIVLDGEGRCREFREHWVHKLKEE